MSGLVQGTLLKPNGFFRKFAWDDWKMTSKMITHPTQTLKEADPTNIFLGIGVECRYDPDR